MINYSKQNISADDISAVSKVLKSDFLTQGPIVPKFESAISKYTSAKYSVVVNSASSGLYLACKALKLTSNDYIWTVSNSFAATANCIKLCGYKIDFVDIDDKNWNLSLAELRNKLIKAKKIGKLPKAIIVVHLGGLPVDPIELKKLSKRFRFKIIEDAAHSLGSKYFGEKVGSCKWSDMCVFSFHPVKIITSAEGGCVTTNNKEFFENMKLTRNNGITKEIKKFKNKNLGGWYYEQHSLGFNFRMNEIQAALGLNQLKKLKLFVKKRNIIAKIYRNRLKKFPLYFQENSKNFLSSYHLFIIKVKNKKNHKILFNYLRKNKIFVNLHYLPIHLHPFYRSLGFKKNDYPNSENYSLSALSIPIYPNLKLKDQNKVIKLISNFFKKYEK